MTIAQDLHDLKEMMKHPGYAVLMRELGPEIKRSEDALIDPSLNLRDDKSLHYARGALWAAKRYFTIPLQLIARLEGNLLLERNAELSKTKPGDK